jgi:hypothetical protein
VRSLDETYGSPHVSDLPCKILIFVSQFGDCLSTRDRCESVDLGEYSADFHMSEKAKSVTSEFVEKPLALDGAVMHECKACERS